MERLIPDQVTAAACRWLLDGAAEGRYRGPRPPLDHELAPLLSTETGRPRLGLSSAAAWTRIHQTMAPALRRLDRAGVHVWAIKGYDLALSVYPRPGSRPMRDADLMVRTEDLPVVRNVLKTLGWSEASPGDGLLYSGIVAECKYQKGSVLVETHTHPFYYPALYPGRLPPDLLEDGRSLGPGLRGLNWRYAMLIVAVHALTSPPLRAVWWTDLALLSATVDESVGWAGFSFWACNSGLGPGVGRLLQTLRRRTGAPVPRRVIDVLLAAPDRSVVLSSIRKGGGRPTLRNVLALRGWRKLSFAVCTIFRVFGSRPPLTGSR
ncbi:hypothetical protein GF402_07835 [Candidatus Fermentibacteria bacterium]|nr:hypothetical protein [Candidatus Fermentibacteria bacterium]